MESFISTSTSEFSSHHKSTVSEACRNHVIWQLHLRLQIDISHNSTSSAFIFFLHRPCRNSLLIYYPASKWALGTLIIIQYEYTPVLCCRFYSASSSSIRNMSQFLLVIQLSYPSRSSFVTSTLVLQSRLIGYDSLPSPRAGRT